jgi:MFS family permease
VLPLSLSLPLSLRPMRHRAFAITWTGSLVSNIGTWMQTVAVGALVTGVTRNPIWTAVAFVAGFLPNGVLAPVGGALADRLDRRRAIIAGVTVEAAISAVLAVVVGAGNTDPYLITALVFVAGCVGALRMPFQQAVLPDLVPPEDIVGAISLGSAQWNLGRVAGPALAGLVIVGGSFSAAFAVNAVSFAAVIVSFFFVRLPPPVDPGAHVGILAHMGDGVRVVRSSPALRSAIGLIALAAAFTSPFIALVPAVAARLVDATGDAKAIAGATGVLTTAQGVGAVVAALVFPSLVASFGRRRMLLIVLFLTPFALVPYALAGSVPVAAAAIVVVGGAYICILSGLSAVVQLRAPAAYRGRILSLYFATLSVVFPLGALVQGVLARRVGLRATTIGGAVAMVAALAVIAIARPSVFRSLADEGIRHFSERSSILERRTS